VTPEGAVVNAVLEYLHARRIFAWRNNTGAVKVRSPSGGERFLRFGKVGSSDVIGCLPDGRFLGVECKAAGGRLSAPQADFIASIRDRGGVAFVAFSLEDVERELERAGYGLESRRRTS